MKKEALIIIDVQKGFDDPSWGVRNNLNAEQNIVQLLQFWRKLRQPVFHIRHCSLNPNSPLHPESIGNEFKAEVRPLSAEIEIQKSVNSGFIDTNLEEILRNEGIEDLVIVGLTTDHCVSTTTRMAGNLGFRVTLIEDATATFDRMGHDGKKYSATEIHNIHLTSLNGEFCEISSTKKVLLNKSINDVMED